MSPRQKVRICAVLAAIGIGIGACRQEPETNSDFAQLTECYSTYPAPVELSMAAEPQLIEERLMLLLNRDLPGHGQLFEFNPVTQKLGIDLKKGRYLPRRLFFVTQRGHPNRGSLWMIFDHYRGEVPATQVIVNGLDRSEPAFLTDGNEDARQKQLNLYRIAIVDRRTRVGPTYVSKTGRNPFVRYEHDSDYVKKEWEVSECFGRPLTAVPRKWEEERDRRLEANRPTKWFGS
jgi:hypothetical protein